MSGIYKVIPGRRIIPCWVYCPAGGKFWRKTFLSFSISLFSHAEADPLLHINAMLHEAWENDFLSKLVKGANRG